MKGRSRAIVDKVQKAPSASRSASATIRQRANLNKTAPASATTRRKKKLTKKKKISWKVEKVPRRGQVAPYQFTDPPRPEAKHDWANDLRSEQPKQPSKKKTTSKKKKTREQTLKSKMLSIKFVARINSSAERQKMEEQKRDQDAKKLKDWLTEKRKKSKKKMQNFDIHTYTDAAGKTNRHVPRVGGLRNPYDLEGVQWIPAERLGEWREEGKKKKWSSSFHTASYSAAPSRPQPHKLRNQATTRRAVKPRLIHFGEFGESEWILCKQSQDKHYQHHAENMMQLQRARKLFREKFPKSAAASKGGDESRKSTKKKRSAAASKGGDESRKSTKKKSAPKKNAPEASEAPKNVPTAYLGMLVPEKKVQKTSEPTTSEPTTSEPTKSC